MVQCTLRGSSKSKREAALLDQFLASARKARCLGPAEAGARRLRGGHNRGEHFQKRKDSAKGGDIGPDSHGEGGEKEGIASGNLGIVDMGNDAVVVVDMRVDVVDFADALGVEGEGGGANVTLAGGIVGVDLAIGGAGVHLEYEGGEADVVTLIEFEGRTAEAKFRLHTANIVDGKAAEAKLCGSGVCKDQGLLEEGAASESYAFHRSRKRCDRGEVKHERKREEAGCKGVGHGKLYNGSATFAMWMAAGEGGGELASGKDQQGVIHGMETKLSSFLNT